MNDNAERHLQVIPESVRESVRRKGTLDRIRAEGQCAAVAAWQEHLLHHGSCHGLTWEAITMALSCSISALREAMYNATHGDKGPVGWPLHILERGNYLTPVRSRATGEDVRRMAESVAEAGWWVLKIEQEGEDENLGGGFVYASRLTLTEPLACPDHGVLW